MLDDKTALERIEKVRTELVLIRDEREQTWVPSQDAANAAVQRAIVDLYDALVFFAPDKYGI